MRDCDVSQPVYTMTVVTPSRSSFLSGAPNEVITVPETEVTLTFDPYPSRRCNVNNSSRHLPGGVRAPLSLIGWWHAELSFERASVCENQGGLMSFNETDVEPR